MKKNNKDKNNKKIIAIVSIISVLIIISVVLINIFSSSNVQKIKETIKDIRLEDRLLIKNVYFEEKEEFNLLHMTISNDTKEDIITIGYTIKILDSKNEIIHEFVGIELDVVTPNQETHSYTEIKKSIDLSKAKKIVYEKIQ